MSAADGSGRHARLPRPLFHPCELAVCGRSGSGKTTLLEKLLAALAGRGLRPGYAKRDVHGFQLDTAGKDTWRAGQAGALARQIQSPADWGALGTGVETPARRLQHFSGCDLVLVEGYRRETALDKLLFLEGVEDEAHTRVVGFLSADPALSGRPLPAERRARLAPDAPADAPVFHRDDVEGILAWLLGRWRAEQETRLLMGLVLAGGKSERMGRDKALLEWDGLPQAGRAASLLEGRCAEVWISARPGQGREALGRPVLEDRFLELGPAGGILSALHARPQAAWLVLGCDLPFVTPAVLDALLAGRNPWRAATAFRDPGSGLPEPLCAVWEPRSRADLLGALAAGWSCPRHVLEWSSATLLDLPDPRALENVNRPEEWEAARRRWEASGSN